MKTLPVLAPAFALLPATPAQAQQPAPRPRPNVLRLDLANVAFRNLEYNFSQARGFVLPLLIGYERRLGAHTSGVAELTLNGGNPDMPWTGLGAQGRYYLPGFRGEQALCGLYLAPQVGYRRVQTPVSNGQARSLAGAGAQLGGQVALGPRLRLDASAGVAAWTNLGSPLADGYASYGGYTASYGYGYRNVTLYENYALLPDARFGLGYSF